MFLIVTNRTQIYHDEIDNFNRNNHKEVRINLFKRVSTKVEEFERKGETNRRMLVVYSKLFHGFPAT